MSYGIKSLKILKEIQITVIVGFSAIIVVSVLLSAFLFSSRIF